jgi:putative ABC transport system permease protein
MSRGGGQVPVSRRLLVARPTRTAAGALGIGLAPMLMLLLNGLWTGVQERVTAYDDHLGANLVVVPAGTSGLFADPGVLPLATVSTVEGTEGVADAAPIRTMYLILELPHGKAAVAAVASEPGAPGGPWELAAGRPPAGVAEIAVDALFAAQHGLGVGDRVPVLGHPMRIVGLTAGTAMFMTPLVFTTTDALAGMLGAEGTAGAILVTTGTPGQVTERLRDQGLTVRTPDQLHQASLRLATRIYGAPVRLMVALAFAAGTLIVGLVASTRITEQQRDLGVLKALGATTGRLRRVAVTETFVLTGFGAAAAAALLLATRAVLAWWWPAFPVVVTPVTVARMSVAAAAMALLAAWLPVHRLGRLDPASAFRSR